MATDAASLLAESACFSCFGTGGEIQLMKLSLLAQILTALNPMADTSPQTLLDQAKCYQCYGNSGMWQLMELALLAQIVANGSPSASTSVTCGNGAPSTAPAGGCGFYIQQDSVPPGQVWEYYSGAWH